MYCINLANGRRAPCVRRAAAQGNVHPGSRLLDACRIDGVPVELGVEDPLYLHPTQGSSEGSLM
jgi:hypothetical protein